MTQRDAQTARDHQRLFFSLPSVEVRQQNQKNRCGKNDRDSPLLMNLESPKETARGKEERQTDHRPFQKGIGTARFDPEGKRRHQNRGGGAMKCAGHRHPSSYDIDAR